MARTRTASKKGVDTPKDTGTKSNRTGRTRGSGSWEAWEDRAIAKQAQAMQPWAALKEDGGPAAAWDSLAVAVSSSNEKFKRSGSACQARFKKLLAFHKNNETRDKQATGETADIDEHIEVMTDIYTQIHDQLEQKKTTNSAARAKILMEQKAGAELRDASMTGLVPRDNLCDVTQLDGATSREKGGQRKPQKRARSSSPTPSGEDTDTEVKPDPVPARKRRKTVRERLVDDLSASREHTRKQIQEAQEAEARRHTELRDAMQTMSGAITDLSAAFANDLEERRKDNTNLLTIISTLASKT